MFFIYVLCKKDKDLLIKHGYKLLKGDENSSIWIFENKLDVEFSLSTHAECVFSDIISL